MPLPSAASPGTESKDVTFISDFASTIVPEGACACGAEELGELELAPSAEPICELDCTLTQQLRQP